MAHTIYTPSRIQATSLHSHHTPALSTVSTESTRCTVCVYLVVVVGEHFQFDSGPELWRLRDVLPLPAIEADEELNSFCTVTL